jgi:hypothetical protein
MPDPQHCLRRLLAFSQPALNIQLPGDPGPLTNWTGSGPTHYFMYQTWAYLCVGGRLGGGGVSTKFTGRCLLYVEL